MFIYTCGLDLVLRDLEAVNVDRLSSLKWHCDMKRALTTDACYIDDDDDEDDDDDNDDADSLRKTDAHDNEDKDDDKGC